MSEELYRLREGYLAEQSNLADSLVWMRSVAGQLSSLKGSLAAG